MTEEIIKWQKKVKALRNKGIYYYNKGDLCFFHKAVRLWKMAMELEESCKKTYGLNWRRGLWRRVTEIAKSTI